MPYVMPEFTVSDVDAALVEPKLAPYVIAVSGKGVLRRQPNGQSFYMTYKTEQKAKNGLYRARVALPEAEIVRRWWR